MRIGTYAVTLGSIEQQKRLDVIANNLANTNTPGFKREEVRFSDFVTETTQTVWDQGPARMTDRPLDIALTGEGFFKVKSEEGTLYSRAGNLTLNKDNTLVTQEGLPVLGKNGPIQAENDALRIEKDGQVFDGDQVIDTIDLVRFPEGTALIKGKYGCIRPAEDGVEPVAAPDCTIQQGALEGANFSAVEEMARMVDTMRVFEAYQKVLQTVHQDMDTQLISKLGGA